MSLHINSREHLKQRQEVKPLTMEEEELLLSNFEYAINSTFTGARRVLVTSLMQNLIYNYENYKHFFIISQSKTADMEVQYEIVNSKMNNT